MTKVIVGKWGKNLAVRIPFDVADGIKLRDGEPIDIEISDGDIVLRRPSLRARRDGLAAMQEIIEERNAFSLGNIPIGDLIDEGRRG